MCNMKNITEINSIKKHGRLALDIKETAESLGVSKRTVYNLCDRGLLRPSRALRKPLFPITEIERFLNVTSETLGVLK